MPYQLNFNLQQRATVRAALSFWEKKEVKDRAVAFFRSCDGFEDYGVQRKWSKFTKARVDEWNKDLLPKHLEDELIHIVRMIEEKILRWYQYIKYEYEVEEKAIKRIDEVKIFQLFWFQNTNLNITKAYNLVYEYTLANYIVDLSHKILKNIRDNDYNSIYKRSDRHILINKCNY